MKLMIKILKSPYVSIMCFTLVFALLFLAFDMPAQKAKAKKYSGEELFTSILFLKGEVADKVPELAMLKRQFKSKMNRKLKANEDKLSQDMVKFIKEKYPRYFSKFQADIQSGNKEKIAAAFKSMRVPIISYLKAQKELPSSLRDSRQLTAMLTGLKKEMRSNQRKILLNKYKKYNSPALDYVLDQYVKEHQDEIMANNNLPGQGPIPFPPVEPIPAPSPPGEWPAMDDLQVQVSNPFPQLDDATFIQTTQQAFQHYHVPGIDVAVDVDAVIYLYAVAAVAVLAILLAIDMTPFTADSANSLYTEGLQSSIASNLGI